MDLFKTLDEILKESCSVNISVSKKGNELVVGVLPANNLVKDGAKNSIVPLNISGTAEELDNGFCQAIKEPIERTCGLLIDLKSFEDAEKEAKEKSQMLKSQKQERDKRLKTFNSYISLIEKNINESKFKDALTCIEKAKDFGKEPIQVKKLKDLSDKVNNIFGPGNMFGVSNDMSDGKNISLSADKKEINSDDKEKEEEKEEE